MSFLSKFQDPYKEEVQAEIYILSEVLGSLGISHKPPEDCKKLEDKRTFLISQLKHVPQIIERLKSEDAKRYNLAKTRLGMDLEFFKRKEIELNEKLRNEEDERMKQKWEYEKLIKKLKEENEFLRDGKEKIYILREGI